MSALKSDHVVAERVRLNQRIRQTTESIYKVLKPRLMVDHNGLEFAVKAIQKYVTRRVRSELQRARRGPRP